ncbi:MAG: hypothetical protein AAF709_11330, partial [Pseudomonadota bacterium]
IEIDDLDDDDAETDDESTADDPDAEMDVEDELEAADVDDDDTEEDDPEPETAIEAPQFWGAEDKALFAELTPEAQEIVLKVDQQREAAVRRKIEDSGTARKAAEERAKVYDQRLTQLEGFVTETDAAIAQYDKDLEQAGWDLRFAYAEGDPELTAKLRKEKLRYLSLKSQSDKGKAAIAEAEQTRRDENETAVNQALPHLRDDEKRQLTDYGIAAGVIDSSNADFDLKKDVIAPEIVVLAKAMMYDQSQHAVRSGKNPPRPKSGAKSQGKGVKPGAATASSSQQTRRKKLARKRSLNMDEASALLGDL